MKKLILAFLLISTVCSAQEPYTLEFPYLLYSQKHVANSTIAGDVEVIEYQSTVSFNGPEIEVNTIYWTETLYKESVLSKDTYLCRTENGSIAIVSFVDIKDPVKQKVLCIFYGNRAYYFLYKIK